MTTLHINIQVNDLDAFRANFAERAEERRARDVRSTAVRHAVDDPSQVVIDLDFDSRADADRYLAFVREEVWKDNPVLVGTPRASILEPLEPALV
ncbi:MAG TPA: hypothetical protein VJM33_10270 [Microthrixaceae bacterium]|nr:hypothetical protein [Microthrixaceae bacterium]